jgi:hypothetical protein
MHPGRFALQIGCRQSAHLAATQGFRPTAGPIIVTRRVTLLWILVAWSAAADDTRVLPIATRKQASDSPPEGWCGETAIQEALLHFGVWAPQRLINRAGKPAHPDLYSNDVPVALAGLGVRYAFYPGPRAFAPFAEWVARGVDAGDPVLAGVKILPTAHPEWGLDHFVLVVGHGERGLLADTTWGTRAWVGDTTTPGLSFKDPSYAIRIRGVWTPARAVPARLAVIEESGAKLVVRADCTRGAAGTAYRVEVRRSPDDREPFRTGDMAPFELALDPDKPARFHCVAR